MFIIYIYIYIYICIFVIIITARSDLWGINSVGFSEQTNMFFELVRTWNGDLGVSDHLWADFFGAELSGGVPGAGDGMREYKLLAMLKHGSRNMQKK